MTRPAASDARPGAGPSLAGARVALVTMPFAGFRHPSLALGLLAAALRERGADVTRHRRHPRVRRDGHPRGVRRPLRMAGAGPAGRAHLRRPHVAAATDRRRRLRGARCSPAEHPAHAVAHFGKPPLTPSLRAVLGGRATAGAGAARRPASRRSSPVRPHVVGFTVMFAQLTASLALAERVKEALPEALIVFGGAGLPRRDGRGPAPALPRRRRSRRRRGRIGAAGARRRARGESRAALPGPWRRAMPTEDDGGSGPSRSEPAAAPPTSTPSPSRTSATTSPAWKRARSPGSFTPRVPWRPPEAAGGASGSAACSAARPAPPSRTGARARPVHSRSSST